MTTLEFKKLQAELARVKAARLEMEVRLEELQEATNRINEQINVQILKETELLNKLEE